jgi:hypothetical protein
VNSGFCETGKQLKNQELSHTKFTKDTKKTIINEKLIKNQELSRTKFTKDTKKTIINEKPISFQRRIEGVKK